MKTSCRIYISGIVQGVFFRNFVKENADKLDIKGFVRNLEDSRVEAFLEGEKTKVDSLIAIIKKGPKQSKIDNIELKEEKFQDLKGFKILHI